MRKLLVPLILIFFGGMHVIPAFSQAGDIAEITAEQYLLTHDDVEFIIYYGFAGSFEIEIEKDVRHPIVSSMGINSEKKSLEINFEKTPEISLIWFRLPAELISAEGGKFVLLVDGIEKEYDLVVYQKGIRIGFILDEGTEKVEIIGTRVIPEFGLIILVFSASIIIPIILKNNLLPFKNNIL